MTENANDNKSKSDDGKPSEPLDLDLNFVPEWARKPPQTNYFGNDKGGQRSGGRAQRPGGRSQRPGGSGQRPDNRGQRPGGQGQRPDNRGQGQRPANNRDQKPGGRGQRPGGQGQRPDFRRDRPERVEIAAVSVRFIPLQKAISEIARKVKSSNRAYPMMQIAGLYLDNPESCSARVEVEKSAKEMQLLQCKICGMIALKEETLYRHMIKAHMADFMDAEEHEGELPTGSFSCISQCGLSGALLGPPNHHSYAEKIREIHKNSYLNMSLQNYKDRIKTIQGEEIVEKWKQEYSHRTTYRPKGNETEKPMSQAKAEAYFLKEIAPKQLQKTKRAALPVPMCREIADMGLQLAIKNEWMKEHRFPSSIMMALRGAFLSKGLLIFKTGKGKGKGKGMAFVTPIKFVPIKLEHAVDSIKEVMLHLQAHPGSSRAQLAKALRPDAEKDSEEIKEILSPLIWLIDRGHIIEFFDGTLSVPRVQEK